ncbi:MAG: hypothetical protein DMF31_05805 [Verrucomicrobia bacterium]|nr:MAG: hypothetical protein DMF31_05805 [Verrucomicrobiota bacterium]
MSRRSQIWKNLPGKHTRTNRLTGVYAEGVKTLDAELADMAKSDLPDYSFSDITVVFPHPKMAVMTYKAKLQATADGKDISGTYNSGSVWVQQGGKWVGAFHTESKMQ